MRHTRTNWFRGHYYGYDSKLNAVLHVGTVLVFGIIAAYACQHPHVISAYISSLF